MSTPFQITMKTASVAFDLDGTLARVDNKPFSANRIGAPIPKMIAKLKGYLAKGEDAVIFTARAADTKNVPAIKKWLDRYNLGSLKVTNEKTPDMHKFYDDRAVAVEKNTGVLKKAIVNEGMQPHQQNLVNRMKMPGQPGLLAYHGLGSGKSRESIEAYKALGMPDTSAIVPASLQGNYRSELIKWLGRVPPNFNIVSQQLVARNGLQGYDNPFLIIDESQKAKDSQSKLQLALQTSKAKKKLLLSGTPHPNHPYEIAPMINFISGKRLLPTNKSEFEAQYVRQKKVYPPFMARLMGVKPGYEPELKNTDALRKILNKYTDYYQTPQKNFPSIKEQVVKVPMGPNQTEIYNAILGKASWWQRYKVKHNLPPGKGELDSMRAFLSGARQISNTNREFISNRRNEESPKAQAAFKFFQQQLKQDPNYKAVIYSNFLNSGIEPYKALLQKNNIPFGEFTGNIGSREREEAIKQYNANKIKALLISGAGAEGLSLKGTRLEQLIDPSWNEAKAQQVIARGARYKSHSHLPPDQQNLLVQRYLSQPQGNWWDRLLRQNTVRGTDEYIYNLAQKKEILNKQLVDLIQRQH